MIDNTTTLVSAASQPNEARSSRRGDVEVAVLWFCTTYIDKDLRTVNFYWLWSGGLYQSGIGCVLILRTLQPIIAMVEKRDGIGLG